MNKRDKIKGRRLNWAEVGATRFSRFCGVAILKSGVFGQYGPSVTTLLIGVAAPKVAEPRSAE